MAGSAALFLNKAEASILCRYLTDGVHSKLMLFHSSYIMHFWGEFQFILPKWENSITQSELEADVQ